jgi:hypothetical protein
MFIMPIRCLCYEQAIKPHAFGKASCVKDFHIGYEASEINARDRRSPFPMVNASEHQRLKNASAALLVVERARNASFARRISNIRRAGALTLSRERAPRSITIAIKSSRET